MVVRSVTLLVIVSACSDNVTASPESSPAVKPPVPVTSAATALAKTFAPEVVGTLVPTKPIAGDYAMALTMSFSMFVTTEMKIDDHRTGAFRLTLGSDGTAQACLGARNIHTVAGQYHYKPAGQREHSRTEDARVVGLSGHWQVVDGVAAIQLDHVSWNTCDLATATKLDKPVAELRCVAVAATTKLPAAALACEATDASQLERLGMPMTASPTTGPGPGHRGLAGHQLVLGAPGLAVDVAQDSHAKVPTFTFRAAPVTIVETDYRIKK